MKVISLSKKLFLISVTILLGSLLFENIVIYRNSYHLVSESLELSTQSMVQNHANNIDDFFRRTGTISDLMISEIPAQLPSLEDTDGDFFDQYRSYNSLKSKFNTLLKAAIGQDIRYRAYLCLHDIYPMTSFLPSPEDDFLSVSASSYVNSSLVVISETNLTDCPWFLRTLENAGSSFWFMHAENPDTIWIASSLEGNFLKNSIVEHDSIGIFLIGIDVSWITGKLDSNFAEGTSLLFLTDSNDRIIYARDTSLLNQDIRLLTSDGKTPYHTWESNLADQIHLFLLLPESAFTHQIHMELQLLIWLLFFILIIGILLFGFYSRFITRPIRKLSSHMESQTQLSPIEPYRSRDEIGVLYRVFNEMTEKQQELIQQIYHYSEEQKQLKYQMLQAQINPHFLYNTLDSVGCAALMMGEGQLTDILSCLAALLRYNINAPEQLVTLDEEVQMTADYIKIQQFRYDGCLRYSCEISPDAARTKVPKSVIQPLIENCIMYGRAQPDGSHRLTLRAYAEEAGNLVTVLFTNDISPEYSETDYAGVLNRYLEGCCQLTRNSSGLGIRNVAQRICFVFGEEYGLHYEQHGSELVTVMRLPFFE